MTWPRHFLVEASLTSRRLSDPAAIAAARLADVLERVPLAGRRTALAVGSRGIDRIAQVVAAAAGVVAARGGLPFIVPAMGSHGGATPEGQAQVLASLGIQEDTVGAPVRSSLDTVELGTTPCGIRVFTSSDALAADAVILINRIKPHTDFQGAIGSGLMKIASIGLGKLEGAFECHRAAARRGHETVIRRVAEVVLARVPIACGLALVEDARHELAHVEALPPPAIPAREEELFALAREWMPSLPFPDIDVLIVDEMGKNVSGAGMDPNVLGRRVDGTTDPARRGRIGALYVRGLTAETRGNAIGLGLADVVSSSLVAEMDARATNVNALSALVPAMARVPMHYASDDECLRAAVRIAGADHAVPRARLLRVRNTLELGRFVASEAFADEIANRADLRVVSGPHEWRFDAAGNFDPPGRFA